MTQLDEIQLEANLREHVRGLLNKLPDTARGVYYRDNIADPNTSLMNVAQTVLYHFDARNQQGVAEALGLTWSELRVMLVGFVLGVEMSQ